MSTEIGNILTGGQRSLLVSSMDHIPADPDSVRAMIERSGMSQASVARLLGVGTRSLKRWICPMTSSSYRTPSQQVLRLMQIELGKPHKRLQKANHG